MDRARYGLAGFLLCLALLLNPWLVAWAATDDGQIEVPGLTSLLVICELFLAAMAAVLVAGSRRAWLLPAAVLVVLAVWGVLQGTTVLEYLRYNRFYHGRLAEHHRLLQDVAAARRGAVRLDGETMEVAYRRHGEVVTVQLEIPAGSVLDTAIGVHPGILELHDGRVGFEARLLPEAGEAVRLFRRTISLGDGTDEPFRWRRLSFDLEPYAGRATLELHRSAEPAGEPAVFDLTPADLLLWATPRLRPKRLQQRKNLLLVSLDTVRADHLGFMGYGRDTSPNLDDLAAGGVAFTRCYSQAPWTTPAHAALFTGTYPRAGFAGRPAQDLVRRLDPELPSLAPLLREAGYLTAAFTGGGNVGSELGFAAGFDSFYESRHDDRSIFERAGRWIAEHRDRSFFLFVHTYEAHAPYEEDRFVESESIGRDWLARRTARYDGDIWRADQRLGRLLRALREAGLEEQTLIVVTSDHGEEMDELRQANSRWLSFGHGHSLYDEVLHVPLVLAGFSGDGKGRAVTSQVRLIDILPTLLEELGLEVPRTVRGESLRRALAGGLMADRPVFSAASTYGAALASLRTPRFKLIYRLSWGQLPHLRSRGLELPPAYQLFDLTADPGERHNLAGSMRPMVDQLFEQALTLAGAEAVPEAADTGGPAPVDSELVDQLRDLGYLD